MVRKFSAKNLGPSFSINWFPHLNLWSVSHSFLLWSSSGLGLITRKQAMNGRKSCGCPYLRNGKHELSSVQGLLSCQKKNYKVFLSFSEVIYFWLCKSLLLSHNCIIYEIILWPGACVASPSVLSYWLWNDCHHFIQYLKVPKMKQLPYLLMRFTRKKEHHQKKREQKLSQFGSFQANILTFQICSVKLITIVNRKTTEIQLAVNGKVAEG